MVTGYLLAQRGAHGLVPRVRRSAAVLERNLLVQRRHLITFASGFFESVFYLLAVGLGAGRLIGEIRLADGTTMSYAQFVAPAMLAASSMNGAINEAVFGLTVRLKFARVYDSVLATPIAVRDIVAGELAWSLGTGVLYSAAFLGLIALLGLVASWWTLLTLPAVVLIGLAFGGLGLAYATYLRDWRDFEYVAIVIFVQFVFSGTFAPIDAYPDWVRTVMTATPLYHGVELVRDSVTGRIDAGSLGHATYLIVVAVIGFAIGGRRLDRQMLR